MTQKQALAILKTGANVFLTGEPGSGKTHTINEYVRYLRSHGLDVAITASTGIAATHIHGLTLHSWSGIGVRESLTQQDMHRIASNSRTKKRIKDANVLVIDEVSMLSGNQLDMVDAVCRYVRESDDSFGGLQVVFVGDFFQLPPVTRRSDLKQFAFESIAWQRINPVVCYLTEQHRQQDGQLLELLTALRGNSFAQSHYELLDKCVLKSMSLQEDLPRLYSHNVDVDKLNDEKLGQLRTKPRSFNMNTRGSAALVDSLKRGCLSPELLELKVGASVMFTKNSPQGDFANGTLGRVVSFDSKGKYPVVETIAKRKITVEPMEWVMEEQGEVKASIVQIPLRLAWAITIHKSQGMSMDAATMDLSQVFEYGQGYVALSRVRTLQGLYLKGFNNRSLEVHPQILERDAFFRNFSNKATEKLLSLSDAEMLERHHNFILNSGGSLETKKVVNKQGDTYSETLRLVKQRLSVEDMAKARGLSATTIFSHLEKLKSRDDLKTKDIDYLQPADKTFGRSLSEIKKAFKSQGLEKLKPVYEHLDGKYDYDTLRLARLLTD